MSIKENTGLKEFFNQLIKKIDNLDNFSHNEINVKNKTYINDRDRIKLSINHNYKGDNEMMDELQEEIIDYLVEYFEVSRLQASEYIPLIPKDSMKDLLREFGKTEKEIKKLVR